MTDKADIEASQDLQRFGYKQEMDRTVHKFASFAMGFSFISITLGVFGVYGTILVLGGPIGIWQWPIVALGTLTIALVFAALAARMPLAGYAYQWVSRLSNPQFGWMVGWILFAFLAVDVVSVDYLGAQAIIPALFGYTGTVTNMVVVTGIMIGIQCLLIMFSTVLCEWINNAAVVTEIVGLILVGGLIVIVGAITHKLYWSHLFSKGNFAGTPHYFSLGTLTHVGPFILVSLFAIYNLIGYEAAANLGEETKDPYRTAPVAIVRCVIISGIVGFLGYASITLGTWNIPALSASGTPAADVVRHIFGSAPTTFFLCFVLLCDFACGLVIFITGSRLMWAMSRDKRFPGHQVASRISKRFGTPFNATLALGVLMEAILLGFGFRPNALTPLLGAASLIPTCVYVCVIVVFIIAKKRRTLPPEQGWSLGRWEWPVAIISLCWCAWVLSIFRDASFKTTWFYFLGMIGVGAIYYVYLLLTKYSFAMPGENVIPQRDNLEETSPDRTEDLTPVK